MSTTEATTFDPYDYAFQEDPYPTYAWLRDHAPVFHHDEHEFWALARHADVKAALSDPTTFSNSHGVSIDPTSWGEHAHHTLSFLAMDPPHQTRLRSLVSRGFTPRRVADLAPRIRELTDAYLTPALERGTFDWIGDVAGRLPMDVISEMMGVPEADRAEVRRLADLVVHREPGIRDVPPAGMHASLELLTYYRQMVDQRRRAPTDDLTSALVAAEVDGDRLTDDEIMAFLFVMVVAGNETTAKLLGHAVWWATRRPDQLTTVQADPTRVDDWIDETLRYDTSSQMIARHVTRDVELHDRVVPAGSQLLLLLGSANRDPRVFADPDVYDLDRDTSDLLSFGHGRHFCLGANLARLEARIVLSELLPRVRSIEVDASGAERVHSINVRGFARLPVRMEVR